MHPRKIMKITQSFVGGLSQLPSLQSGVLVMVCVYCLLFVGCGSVPTRNPIPEKLGNEAIIPGIPKAKAWGDESPPWADAWFSRTEEQIKTRYPGLYGGELSYLAISGGGANGAFSAGFLQGWTESGRRPEFTMVTGVSTGALISPFAFLGSNYDATLKEIYTGISTKDILTKRSLFVGLTSDALADTAPLMKLIQKYVTPDILKALATEFRKGRQLNVGTTNLDAA